LPLISTGSFLSSTLLSSPPSFFLLYRSRPTYDTCQGLHNLHITIHNCSCM
jgi:hypothetical protein